MSSSRALRIVILGRGRMGREISRVALEAGHEVVAELDRRSGLGEGGIPAAVDGADVAVDFTTGDAVPDTVRRLSGAGLPVVVGTTGWNDRLDDVRRVVMSNGTALVYGANFSIGANVLLALVSRAAEFVDRFPEYDPYVLEHHHRHKTDAPSGTGIRLAETLVERLGRKDRVETAPSCAPVDESALQVVAIRAGSAFGRHMVGFDSPADVIEISHVAKSRKGFARGAVFAAEWIVGKTGVFEFHELFEGRLS